MLSPLTARQGIENGFLQRNYGLGSGILYKPDNLFRIFSFLFDGQHWSEEAEDIRLVYIDDNPESYKNIFYNAKTPIAIKDQMRLIQALKKLGKGANPDKAEDVDLEGTVNVEEVIRYFVSHNYVVNGDSYTGSAVHNYYLHEKNGILSMIPWDYNLAFGGFGEISLSKSPGEIATEAVNDPIDSPLSIAGNGKRPMADWIFTNQKYLKRYHELFQEFLDQVEPLEIINETEALIADDVSHDISSFCTFEQFQKGVATLRSFCNLRTKSVQEQLNGLIPSTDNGQKAYPFNLVDASALNLNDLGPMEFPEMKSGLPLPPDVP